MPRRPVVEPGGGTPPAEDTVKPLTSEELATISAARARRRREIERKALAAVRARRSAARRAMKAAQDDETE
jgi:hypothetical protein